LESGGASGWPATDWIENLLLTGAGVDAYDAWTFHEMPFDSPAVRRAFAQLDEVVFKEGSVRGGPRGAISENIFDAPYPLIGDPPGCWFHLQSSFAAGFLPRGAAGRDTDVFPFPPMSGDTPSLIGGGNLVGAFSDRPEVREVVRFLLSPEHGADWAKFGIQFMSANRQFDPDNYAPFWRKQAEALEAALANDTFRFDASDLMPPPIGNRVFLHAMVRYFAQGPESLDRILTRLDAAWSDTAEGAAT